MTIILDMWDTYQKDVVPATASETQRSETRRAFYAGAAAAFYGVARKVAEAAGEESPEIFDSVHKEITDFRAAIDAGVA